MKEMMHGVNEGNGGKSKRTGWRLRGGTRLVGVELQGKAGSGLVNLRTPNFDFSGPSYFALLCS